MKYEKNPNLPHQFFAGDTFFNRKSTATYKLVFTGQLYLVNTATHSWYTPDNPGNGHSYTDFAGLTKIFERGSGLSDMADWSFVPEFDCEKIPLVVEKVEYKRIVEFVYDKNPGYHYGASEAPSWRKLGVTGEDDNYIWGFDLNKNAERKFCKSKIVGGRIITES